MEQTANMAPMGRTKIEVKGLNLYYGDFQALKNVNIRIPEKEITAFIGPSGCGKSTLLNTLNRMNDLVEAAGLKETSCWTRRTSMEIWTSMFCGGGLGWSFKNPIRFP